MRVDPADVDKIAAPGEYRVNGLLLRFRETEEKHRPGDFDEIFATRASLHIETMSEDHLWMVVNGVHLNVGIRKGKLTYSVWAEKRRPLRDFKNVMLWRVRRLFTPRGRRKSHEHGHRGRKRPC